MELLYYLWMEQIKGCGPITVNKLIDRFGSAEAVYQLDDIAALIDIEYLGYETAFALISNKLLDSAKRACDKIIEGSISYLTLSDELYPKLLRNIYDPPAILYYKGSNVTVTNHLSISMVGARKATPYGATAAKNIASQLATNGIQIVSGLASGIDSASHQGALQVGGTTIGVLGCGIDKVYPPSNHRLYRQLLEHDGMIITEFPPGTEPAPSNFPRRNRIISGLTYGVIVVEAAESSGSLITAKYASEQGREVYAVPGNITSNQSAGCHLLIKDGAKLVTCGDDILKDMFHIFRPMVEKETQVLPELTEMEQSIYQLITSGFQTIGELKQHTAMPIDQISGIVTMLELKGIITLDMGKIYLTY